MKKSEYSTRPAIPTTAILTTAVPIMIQFFSQLVRFSPRRDGEKMEILDNSTNPPVNPELSTTRVKDITIQDDNKGFEMDIFKAEAGNSA